MDLLPVLPASPSSWASEVTALDDLAKAQLGAWLVREWIEDRLEARLLPNADAVARRSLRRELAATITALEMDEVDVEWREVRVDDATAARWCWVRPWRLLEQDEDLLLMADDLVEPLLQEVAANCPKRDYAISIVAHHIRDQAFAALHRDADTARERVRALVKFAAPARSARADELVAYLHRLESYTRPSRLTEEEARARILDLSRCHPPTSVTLERRGAEWWSSIDANPSTEQWFVIDSKTGATRIEAPGRDRSRAKGRHSTR